MPQTTFEQALRFLFPGLLIVGCYSVLTDAKIGSIDTLLLGLTAGVLFYSVYRAVFYDLVICVLLDWISIKTGEDNYRTWIQSRYKVDSRKAELIYAIVRPQVPDLNSGTMVQRSALTHFMYQSALIFAMFGIATVFDWCDSITFFVLAAALATAAIVADVHIDRQVCLTLKQEQAEQAVDVVAAKLGYPPQS